MTCVPADFATVAAIDVDAVEGAPVPEGLHGEVHGKGHSRRGEGIAATENAHGRSAGPLEAKGGGERGRRLRDSLSHLPDRPRDRARASEERGP